MQPSARSRVVNISGLVMCLALASASGATTRPASAPATRPALPPAPKGVVIQQDVRYLEPGRLEKLDLYLPADRGRDVRSPAVVMIHGGGWSGGDKANGREFNLGVTLARAGYVCASVNYQLEGPKRWPTDLFDCKNAVRFLRKQADRYGVDLEHIGIIGGSAGGHLALMVAYTSDVPQLEPSTPYPGLSDRVSAVVNMYGITNLITRRSTDAEGNPVGPIRSKAAIVEGSPDDNTAAWRLVSPVYHVSEASPPTLILHGTRDTTVDRDQASELAAKLAEHGVEHQLVLVPGVGHSFDLETWRHKPLPTDLRPMVISFFNKHLKRK
jgi:acetyl esterase/lipase